MPPVSWLRVEGVQMAVLVMCGGAALAGLTDITFNLVGYFWVLVTPSPALAPARPPVSHTPRPFSPLWPFPPRGMRSPTRACAADAGARVRNSGSAAPSGRSPRMRAGARADAGPRSIETRGSNAVINLFCCLSGALRLRCLSP